MKLTMSGEAISHGLSLEECVNLTLKCDISNFELWPSNCGAKEGNPHPRLYRGRDVDFARKTLKKAGIGIACVAFGGAFDDMIASDSNIYGAELARAVEIAASAGAKYVNHYLTKIAPSPEIDCDIVEQYCGKALQRAEELGVVLVLENEGVDVTRTPENMLKLMEHFNSPNFSTNFDATNYYQGGNEAFPHAYSVLKHYISYVHIKNGRIYSERHCRNMAWKGGKMTGRLEGKEIYYTLPWEGAVNILGLIQKLCDDNYQGYFALEPHSVVSEVLEYYKMAIPFIKEYIADCKRGLGNG
jgi:sugar phosphate isomerase/epimerase